MFELLAINLKTSYLTNTWYLNLPEEDDVDSRTYHYFSLLLDRCLLTTDHRRPHRKNSSCARSGDLGDHSAEPRRPFRLSLKLTSRKSRETVATWGWALSWKKTIAPMNFFPVQALRESAAFAGKFRQFHCHPRNKNRRTGLSTLTPAHSTLISGWKQPYCDVTLRQPLGWTKHCRYTLLLKYCFSDHSEPRGVSLCKCLWGACAFGCEGLCVVSLFRYVCINMDV
jgi:hypothetical protein